MARFSLSRIAVAAVVLAGCRLLFAETEFPDLQTIPPDVSVPQAKVAAAAAGQRTFVRLAVCGKSLPWPFSTNANPKKAKVFRGSLPPHPAADHLIHGQLEGHPAEIGYVLSLPDGWDPTRRFSAAPALRGPVAGAGLA